MNLRLIDFSIVVTGHAHNPTILNPDFLKRCEIVPEEWGWELGAPPITTPPLALVQFKSGVTLTVEPGKLHVSDMGDERDPLTSRIPQITTRYLTTLPHVPYSAVGVNFHCIVSLSDPTSHLRERFIKDGPWIKPDRPLQSLGVRFVYEMNEARVTIALEPGAVGPPEGEETVERQAVVSANANFHRPLGTQVGYERAVSIIEHASEDWSSFGELVGEILK